MRRALEYYPVVIFSNGINEKEITHSANEFVIPIPRKTEQVTNHGNLVTEPATQKNDPAQSEVDPVSDQASQNTTNITQKGDQAGDQATQNTTKLLKIRLSSHKKATKLAQPSYSEYDQAKTVKEAARYP